MLSSLIPLLLLPSPSSAPFAQEVHDAYAQQDTATLRTLLERASSRGDSLLVRYRLYPLTENAELLTDIPRQLSGGSAREWALLSGLWSYRAGEASFFSAIDYGRHSAQLLETAQKRDADDPYVLLTGGQSLLFRPAIAGRDVEAAAQRFSTLTQQTEANRADGISPTEARVWEWMALREAGRTDRATSLRERLLSNDPPLSTDSF